MTNLDIFDTDILGRKDANGNIAQLTGKDALKNSITTWLTSFRGDIIRAPNRAGYISRHLYKPMNEANRVNMINAITDGFNQDYYPTVKVNSLKVNPNYENKTWEIDLVVYSYLLKDYTDVSLTIKNFV